MPIVHPEFIPVALGQATQDGLTQRVKAKVVLVDTQGSAILVVGKPVPGTQILLDNIAAAPYQIAQGDFIRPGRNFSRLYVRHEADDGGTLMLAVYPPTDTDDYPSVLRTQPLPQSRGLVNCRHTVAAATTWRGRIQNMEPVGGRIAWVRSIDIHQTTGATLEIRVDMDQAIDATAGTTQEIGWVGNVAAVLAAGKLPEHMPAVRSRTGGAAWADPPAAADFRSFYMSINPDGGIDFPEPYPLMPQREIRIAHLTAPGVTCNVTADIVGEVRPSPVQ